MTKHINRLLDHAVLKPEMTVSEATAAIEIGIHYNVRTVCVRPCDVELAAKLCMGTQTEVCTVIGFPHGTTTSKVKAYEAKDYIAMGAREVDMVANYGYIKSAQWSLLRKDIDSVIEITKLSGILLKVIFETSMLRLDEIAKATEICISAEADFVKTSTGFHGEGASREAVDTMIKAASGKIQVKASGGIRDRKIAEMFANMGCSRLGVGYGSTATICEGGISSASSGY